MNKLMTLENWRNERFTEPRPSLRSCQFWAQKGEIPAIKRGKRWFIDLDRELRMTGNQLVDQFLEM
jgi:hypothetical protein